ncbi:hypothetical protein CCR75_002369 [Bremia lactucae]|uniref:Transmembrane protein n=1 Tax=Bremia lactucae TaxID=4779 RepID=A0A976IFC1_BRELC|nr:hypothetical protein CCR75_002369 [Bremia lactucae]
MPTPDVDENDLAGGRRSLRSIHSIKKSSQWHRKRRYTSAESNSFSRVEYRDRATSDWDEREATNRPLTKEASILFKDLTRLADNNEPVHYDTFRQSSVLRHSRNSEAIHHNVMFNEERKEQKTEDETTGQLNTELLEAYLAYCKSIGHEPNITISDETLSKESDNERSGTDTLAAAYTPERPAVPVTHHFWTGWLGTRYSKQRGCVQFWAWLGIGVGVAVWLGVSLSGLHLNEVLHLDAFIVQKSQVTQDYTYLHFLDKVDFYLTYTIETSSSEIVPPLNNSSSYFNALLMYKTEYEHYTRGEPFQYVTKGSILHTTSAHLPRTYIDNTEGKSLYFVIQPCHLARAPTKNYCRSFQLPSSVSSKEKIYHLNNKARMRHHAAWEHFDVTYISVNPMPVSCRSSGIVGSAYLLLFLPYIIITLFGLRLFQMVIHCESFRQNIERTYARELSVPENEVDYWQPVPWDRKVPKTRLCGPCCWQKCRRPYEPFYTWWRHENYFTWMLYPYRNEQLSRGERTLIVVCSLYITFYVVFLIVMLRDSWGEDMTIFKSVVVYTILAGVLPSGGKAIFKELFKLIFRQRRKYFRNKASGRDLETFSFRVAFFLQLLVVILLTLVQGPIFYIWTFRSCLFLQHFIYYGVLAAVARMSLLGLVPDLVWYLILKTWGWKDLCPYCTERIKHCDCFNDEVLVLAIEHLGPKWTLIRDLDRLLAKEAQYESQFTLYTSEQLRERWDVIVERAETHMTKVAKLRMYCHKKQQDACCTSRVLTRKDHVLSSSHCDLENALAKEGIESTMPLCHVREEKILALHSKIQLDAFEKHYDSTIAEVFTALARSVKSRRRHEVLKTCMHVEGFHDMVERKSLCRNSDVRETGETMWVFDTPAQRLERRQEEKWQRKRAFRILKDVEMESSKDLSVEAASSPSSFDQKTQWMSLETAPNRLENRQEEKKMIVTPHSTCSNTKREQDSLDRDGYNSDKSVDDLERGEAHSTLSARTDVHTVTERRTSRVRRFLAFAEAFTACLSAYNPKAQS